jgi:hypothetical protein
LFAPSPDGETMGTARGANNPVLALLLFGDLLVRGS